MASDSGSGSPSGSDGGSYWDSYSDSESFSDDSPWLVSGSDSSSICGWYETEPLLITFFSFKSSKISARLLKKLMCKS